MQVVKTPIFVKKLYKSLYWNLSREKKTLYLTFDDGPTPDITEKVLGLLNRFKAKATFFVLGRNVDRYSSIYNSVLEQGHAPGNHTYSHLQGWKTRNKEYFKDIELAGITVHSKLFRPPYGKITRPQLLHLRKLYSIIMWDIMSYDYSPMVTPQQCFGYVQNHAAPGSIIVFHDSVKASKNMFYALEKTLDYFSERGYAFNAINQSDLKLNAV